MAQATPPRSVGWVALLGGLAIGFGGALLLVAPLSGTAAAVFGKLVGVLVLGFGGLMVWVGLRTIRG